MKTKDFEAAVSRLATRLEKYIEPVEVRIRKGQVRWFVCKLDGELLVFDYRGYCYRSYRKVEPIEPDGAIIYYNEGVKAYGIYCRVSVASDLNFDEPCT